MKQLIYQVYTGKQSNLYDWCTASVKAYADSIGADYYVQREPILMIKPDVFATNRSMESYGKHGGFLPIYEKENAFGYFDRYDQIAIIDADVWIRPSSPNVFDELNGADFAGVLERDMPLGPEYVRKIVNYSRMQYGSSLKNLMNWSDRGADFYNMGIMVMDNSIAKYLNGQTPHEFIMRSEFKDFVDGVGAWKWSTDQTLLNYWVKKEKMKVSNLSWHWNGLYSAIPSKYVEEANFVHFFLKDKLPAKGENVKQLMKDVSP